MQNKQLPISLLVVLNIGAMIGLSVFNLPSVLASEANVGAIMISWIINIVGVLSIAYTFKILSHKKRANIGGLYAYSKNLTGEFGATIVAYGYYASTVFCILFFFQSGMQGLAVLLPSIGSTPGSGLNLTQLILASIVLWYLSLSMFKGVLEVSNISLVATAFKVLPLILIIIAGMISFDFANITVSIQDESRILEIGNWNQQLKTTTSSMLWMFVGFEGISVLSGRAYKNTEVGSAIMWSLGITALLYFLVTVSCLGVMPVNELAKLPPASTGFVLEQLVGKWGQIFITFSMIVSVFGAILIWGMFGVEILYLASKDHLFIDKLGVQHEGNPRNAVLFTVIIIQILLIVGYIIGINFRVFDIVMTTTLLLPYTITVIYCFKYVTDGNHYDSNWKQMRDLAVTLSAVAYILWVMYATGFKMLVVSVGIYTFGLIIYICNKAIRREKIFTKLSFISSIVILLAGIFSIIYVINEMI